MKYRNTGNGIISTFVKLSFLSMSVMRQIWKALRQLMLCTTFDSINDFITISFSQRRDMLSI